MRSALALSTLLVLGVIAVGTGPVAAQERYDAVDLRLTRVVGVIEVETGGVDRITVDYDPGEGLIDPPSFDVEGTELVVTQLRRRDDVSCRSRGQGRQLRIERGAYNPIESYGRLVIRAPAGARVSIEGGAITGSVGDVGELHVGLSSCGDLTIGDVAGEAEVAVNGSGDIEVGAVGDGLEIAVNGSGDVTVGPVTGGLEAAINGSGEIEIASVDGDIEAAINGSGDVLIRGGRAGSIEAAIMGSGDVRFEGVARDVKLSAFGSGDVFVAEVTGDVSTASFGSGRVHVGRD